MTSGSFDFNIFFGFWSNFGIILCEWNRKESLPSYVIDKDLSSDKTKNSPVIAFILHLFNISPETFAWAEVKKKSESVANFFVRTITSIIRS